MAVNRHLTASAHHRGNFTAGKLPTITLEISIFLFCRPRAGYMVNPYSAISDDHTRIERGVLLTLRERARGEAFSLRFIPI